MISEIALDEDSGRSVHQIIQQDNKTRNTFSLLPTYPLSPSFKLGVILLQLV